jgi:hypothetical protein
MRPFKNLILFISLLLFIGNKAHSSYPVVKYKKVFTGKSDSFKSPVKIIKHKKLAPLKRKRKPRGIKRVIPQVPDITIEQTWTYKEFQPVWLQDFFSSLLYSAHHKRGPPQV